MKRDYGITESLPTLYHFPGSFIKAIFTALSARPSCFHDFSLPAAIIILPGALPPLPFVLLLWPSLFGLATKAESPDVV